MKYQNNDWFKDNLYKENVNTLVKVLFLKTGISKCSFIIPILSIYFAQNINKK